MFIRMAIATICLTSSFLFACGTERWDVKTLADNNSAAIDFTPLDSSVERLLMYPAPKNLRKLTNRVRPVETHVWRINVILVGIKVETDGDYHLVIMSPANLSHTMIAEIPDPACMPLAYRPQVTAARNWVATNLGRIGQYKKLAPPMMIIMTGVGFFDFLHGQTGVAHNGVEIHPVLSIEKASSTSFTDADDLPYGQ